MVSLLPPFHCHPDWRPTLVAYQKKHTLETALQTALLYHGLWLSRKAIQNASGTAALTQANLDPRAFVALHYVLAHYRLSFDLAEYGAPWSSPASFLRWMEYHTRHGHPVLLRVARRWPPRRGTTDAPSYDHVVTAVAFDTVRRRFLLCDPYPKDRASSNVYVPEADLVVTHRPPPTTACFAVVHGHYHAVALCGFQQPRVPMPPPLRPTEPRVLVAALQEGHPPGGSHCCALLCLLDLLPGRAYRVERIHRWQQRNHQSTILLPAFVAADTCLCLRDPYRFSLSANIRWLCLPVGVGGG